MSNVEREGGFSERLAIDSRGVPLIEWEDVSSELGELGLGVCVQTKISVGDFLVKLRSDKTNIVIHENPEYSRYDHVVTNGTIIDPETGASAADIITIFSLRDERIDDEVNASQLRVNDFDMLVFKLEQLGFPVSSFSRDPSAMTMNRYYKSLRGNETIEKIIGRIIQADG